MQGKLWFREGGSFLPFFMAAVPTEDNPSPKWALVFINLLVLWNSICFCLVSFFCFRRWPPAHSMFVTKKQIHSRFIKYSQRTWMSVRLCFACLFACCNALVRRLCWSIHIQHEDSLSSHSACLSVSMCMSVCLVSSVRCSCTLLLSLNTLRQNT